MKKPVANELFSTITIEPQMDWNALAVSVIIPTKNRPEDLGRAVRSLLHQTHLPLELIVIDQSQDETSRTVTLAEYSGSCRTDQKMTALHYILDPAIPGREAARNRGIDQATGDILLFLDDDVELERDCLWQLEATHLAHPEVAGVSAIITNYNPPALVYLVWSRIFKKGPFHDERQPIYWNSDSLNGSKVIEVSKFGGGTASFRRKVVGDLRFDESLEEGAIAEDTDFCLRLPVGVRLVIAPSARLAHWHSPIGRSRSHWLQSSARGDWFLFMKHWRRNMWRLLLFTWLNVGYALVATVTGLRRLSFRPWRDYINGVRNGCLDAGFGRDDN